MAKRVIKFWDKIIVVLLGVLGLSGMLYSCMKYGMPEVENASLYELKGVVTDKETSNPIQNIQIIRRDRDTIYTDIDGKYAFRDINYGGCSYPLKFEDIDGEENGGEFAPVDIYIDFTTEDIVERDRGSVWCDKTINIELEKKK